MSMSRIYFGFGPQRLRGAQNYFSLRSMSAALMISLMNSPVSAATSFIEIVDVEGDVTVNRPASSGMVISTRALTNTLLLPTDTVITGSNGRFTVRTSDDGFLDVTTVGANQKISVKDRWRFSKERNLLEKPTGIGGVRRGEWIASRALNYPKYSKITRGGFTIDTGGFCINARDVAYELSVKGEPVPYNIENFDHFARIVPYLLVADRYYWTLRCERRSITGQFQFITDEEQAFLKKILDTDRRETDHRTVFVFRVGVLRSYELYRDAGVLATQALESFPGDEYFLSVQNEMADRVGMAAESGF